MTAHLSGQGRWICTYTLINNNIIAQVLIEYEMADSQWGALHQVFYNHLIQQTQVDW